MTNRFFIPILLLFSTLVAYAGGYRVSLQSGRALAMGHAGVGVIDNAEGAFFNPSGLVNLKNRLEIAAGVSVVYSTINFKDMDTGKSYKTHNSIFTHLYVYIIIYLTINFILWFCVLYT